MALLLVSLVVVIVSAAIGLWLYERHTRCPRCRHHSATWMAGSLLHPVLYCVLCRSEWMPPLTLYVSWLSRPSRHGTDSRY
jgi:hypothetical protein